MEMIRKEEEKRRERETQKNSKKTKDENIITKKKNKKEKKKQKTNTSSEKIHFLCLKRMMRKMTWTMILRFSQILPPVITSLKAHFHDHQQLKQWKVSI